jgi:hypothetical protein
MLNDWEEFKKNSVFAAGYEPVRTTEQVPQRGNIFTTDSEFKKLFPKLTTLLNSARVTPLETAKGERHLFGWTDKSANHLAWLAYPAGYEGTYSASNDLCPDHKLMLRCFGGVDETSYADEVDKAFPESAHDLLWTLNLKFCLGERDCQPGINGWDDCYEAVQLLEPFPNPINSSDYVTFAVEANGNRIAYHRTDCSVIMFATDHCFDYLTAYPGCPDYLLYRINGAPYFRDWVEMIAHQWTSLRDSRIG